METQRQIMDRATGLKFDASHRLPEKSRNVIYVDDGERRTDKLGRPFLVKRAVQLDHSKNYHRPYVAPVVVKKTRARKAKAAA